MFGFLSSLPGLFGIAGFVVYQLLRSRSRGDAVTRGVIERLRAASPEEPPPSGLRPAQLLRWLALNHDLQRAVSAQDYEVLRQALRQQHRESLLVYLLTGGLCLVSVGLHTYSSLRPQPLELSDFRIESAAPEAKGLAVDTDTLSVTWAAEGEVEDIQVTLQNVQTSRMGEWMRVSSRQHQVLFAPEQYASVLAERGRGGFNRIRVVARSPRRKWNSDEVDLRVGITVLAFYDPDSHDLCITALIDNESIRFYTFQAEAFVWTVGPSPALLDFGETISTPKTCYKIRHPERVRWSELKVAYFGPDDTRLVRTTTLVDEGAATRNAAQ